MKTKTAKAFTLVEILVVIAIIALLISILMPALTQIKKIAANTKQKAQISSIEIGLSLYKNDFGQYPPSHGWKEDSGSPADHNDYTYSGAHTLAEAMFGQDLLGVHPDTVYRADGYDEAGSPKGLLYPLPDATSTPPEPNDTNLNKRKGPYLDRTNIGVYKPNQIFKTLGTLSPSGHMICDVFPVKSEKIGNKRYKIGTPILYFRANLAAENMQSISSAIPPYDPHTKNVYNYCDNLAPILAGRVLENGEIDHKFFETPGNPNGSTFYKFIKDPMVTMPEDATHHGRPVRPDSFLLISAGWDGMYGTSDDICNFEPNIE